ncbi:MAG: hypothetical protein ABUL49_01600, partial [bacterium]
EFTEGVELRVFEVSEGEAASVVVPGLDGSDRLLCTVSCEGGEYRFELEGSFEGVSVLLMNRSGFSDVSGCEALQEGSSIKLRSLERVFSVKRQ